MGDDPYFIKGQNFSSNLGDLSAVLATSFQSKQQMYEKFKSLEAYHFFASAFLCVKTLKHDLSFCC